MPKYSISHSVESERKHFFWHWVNESIVLFMRFLYIIENNVCLGIVTTIKRANSISSQQNNRKPLGDYSAQRPYRNGLIGEVYRVLAKCEFEQSKGIPRRQFEDKCIGEKVNALFNENLVETSVPWNNSAWTNPPLEELAKLANEITPPKEKKMLALDVVTYEGLRAKRSKKKFWRQVSVECGKFVIAFLTRIGLRLGRG